MKNDFEYFSEFVYEDSKELQEKLENNKVLIFEKGLSLIVGEKDYFFKRPEWKKIK